MGELKFRTNGSLLKTSGGSFKCRARDESNYIVLSQFLRAPKDILLDALDGRIAILDGSGNVIASSAYRYTGFLFDTKVVFTDKFVAYGLNFIYRQTGFTNRQFCVMDDQLSPDTNFGITNSYVYNIVPLSNNRILLVGNFSTYTKNGTATGAVRVLVLDEYGDVDLDTTSGANGVVYSGLELSDGKIIIVGGFTSYSSSSCNRIARINTDGTFDSNFNIGTGFNDLVYDVAIQSDGKIIAVGAFTSYNGTSVNKICRLNTNGTLDTTFSIGSGFNYNVASVLVHNGKIYALGDFTSYNGTTVNRIVSLNSNGSINTSFNVGDGLPNNNIAGYGLLNARLKILGDKICIIGNIPSYKTSFVGSVVMVDSSGNIDSTVGNIFNHTSSTPGIDRLPNGKYCCGLAGAISKQNFNSPAIISSIDNQVVSQSSNIFSDVCFGILKLSTGKYLLYGGPYLRSDDLSDNTYYSRSAVRLNSDLSIDTSYNTGNTGLGTGRINSVCLSSSDKVLATGDFTNHNGTTTNRISMINSDGTQDTSFSVGSGLNATGRSMVRQSDGKFVVAGGFTTYNGTTVNRICRINSNGSLDTSFSIGSGFNNIVYAVLLDNNEKILVFGSFTSYNGTTVNRVCRLNSNGSLDTSFSIGSGFDNIVYAASIYSNNKILCGGSFTTFNGTSVSQLCRLNTDGSLDTSFTSGISSMTSPGYMTINCLSDGKTIITPGIAAATYSNQTLYCFRINYDGSIDSSFNLDTLNTYAVFLT